MIRVAPRGRESSPSLRPAGSRDRAFVGKLSPRVFSRFGRYERMVPDWLDGAGVWGFVALKAGEPAGFALVSLAKLPAAAEFPSVRRGTDPDRLLALDLMAIAVEPERQREGLGRMLLDAVLREAGRLAATTSLPLAAVSLTVAVDNHGARRLFQAAGFRPLGWEGETYPRGQEALRMIRPVGPDLDSGPHRHSS